MSIIIFLFALFALPIVIEVVVIIHDICIKDPNKYWGGLE